MALKESEEPSLEQLSAFNPPSAGKAMRKPIIHRMKSSRGSNLVEMAAVIPLLLLFTFAIMDFATLFYVYLSLENGVSQATRYAVTGQVMNDPANPGQTFRGINRLSLPCATRLPRWPLPTVLSPFTTSLRAQPGRAARTISFGCRFNMSLFP